MKHNLNRLSLLAWVVAAVAVTYALATGHAMTPLDWLGFMPVFGSVFYESPNTGTSLATMSADDVRKLWQAGVDVWEQNADFFADMEGGSNSLIWEKTDTSKGKGMKMRFTNMSGFYDEPHMGEELFETSDDFEEILINGYDLTVDFFRHATRVTDRMEEVMGMRGEIVSGLNEEIGKWLGRLKTEQLFMMFREGLNADNVIYGGGAAQNTINGNNTLGWNPIVALSTRMKGLGGLPAMVGKSPNGAPIWKQVLVAPTDVLYALELDPEFRQLLGNVYNERAAGTLFEGGYVDVRGTRIREYVPIDHDGEGAVGSPLLAKAFLGNAITSATAVIDITGGGNPTSAAKTKKHYFKYFPGFNYRFRPDLSLATGSTARYLLIVNPPNAVTDPNKVGMYKYTTGNNGNKITITERLAASTAGVAAKITVGDVTWNTGVWLAGANDFAGHTDVHPQGAAVYACNSKGQVFGDALMMGRGCAVRGYGKYRNKRSQQVWEGDFVTDRFVTSVFGQAPRQDRSGRMPSVARLRVAVTPPGVPLPTIV